MTAEMAGPTAETVAFGAEEAEARRVMGASEDSARRSLGMQEEWLRGSVGRGSPGDVRVEEVPELGKHMEVQLRILPDCGGRDPLSEGTRGLGMPAGTGLTAAAQAATPGAEVGERAGRVAPGRTG